MYRLVYTKQAKQDAKEVASGGLKKQVKKLLALLAEDPFTEPPPYKKLMGDLNGAFSRRINLQHRLVYEIFEEDNIVKVIRMWSHYE